MKNIFYISFLVACATTQPVPSPNSKPCPTCPPSTIIKVHDTVTNYATLFRDTVQNDIILYPIVGENYYQLQDAINFCIAFPSFKLKPTPGTYTYSKILLATNFTGKDFNQITFQLIGSSSAKAAPDQALVIFQGPGLMLQRSKGVRIENIYFKGPLKLDFSQILIQKMKFSDWGAYNRYTPIAGIAVDPFCDSTLINARYAGFEKYYPAGMNRAGSTGLQIIGCKFTGWETGIVLEPTYQQNGDCIDIIDCDIEYSKIAIATTQPQNKGNTVIRLKSWGDVYTIIDGVHYGKGMGVLPYCDVANIAGGTYQLFELGNADFQGSVNDWYAELLFKIGTISGYQTTKVSSITCDFMSDGPVPDFIVKGNINFKDAHLRYYTNGDLKRRLFMPGFCGTFQDGDFDTYPIISSVNNTGVGYCTAAFCHVGLAQEPGSSWSRPFLNSNNYEHPQFVGNFSVIVDTVNWTATTTASIPLNSYVITEDQANGSMQVGRFNGTSLSEVGVNMRTGNYNLYLIK
jgi:hypothetical protein